MPAGRWMVIPHRQFLSISGFPCSFEFLSSSSAISKNPSSKKSSNPHKKAAYTLLDSIIHNRTISGIAKTITVGRLRRKKLSQFARDDYHLRPMTKLWPMTYEKSKPKLSSKSPSCVGRNRFQYFLFLYRLLPLPPSHRHMQSYSTPQFNVNVNFSCRNISAP